MAQAMCLRCDGSHEYCKLEGQFPGLGRSRTSYMEDYQPAMAADLAAAMAAPEDPSAWEDANAVEEVKEVQGKLVQLMTGNRAEATRTVQRFHRNLGHPSPKALCELLESCGASETVMEIIRQFQWHACLRYRKPNQVAPSSLKTVSKFNQIVQADVFWLKDNSNKLPILSMIDEATKFMAALLLKSEKAIDYISALERYWISYFGAPTKLITNEGRNWLHDNFGIWTDEHGIHHAVAASEAHEQLALVERRHAVLRKALEVYLADYGITTASAVRRPSNRPWPTLCPRSTTCLRPQASHLLNGFWDNFLTCLANFLELHLLQFTLVNPLKMNLPGEPQPEWPSSRPTQTRSSGEPFSGSMLA